MVESRASIDWKKIDAELQVVPEEYREPRFYPLRHVVEVFSSGDPQALTVKLRQTQGRLDNAVDLIVESYHNGFARSIQNYSRILQLFQDSKQQVDSLKLSLSDATRQLGAQSKTLNQQWHKSMHLNASVRLLEDIQAAANIPGKVEEALEAKDWVSAVRLLLEGCVKLVHPQMQAVGALKKVRAEVGELAARIQGGVYLELQERIYSHAGASTSHANSLRQPEATLDRRPKKSFAAVRPVGKAGVDGKSLVSNRTSAHKRAGRSNACSLILSGGGAKGSALNSERASRIAPRDGASSPSQLVACLSQLDGVQEAQAFLKYHARTEVRRLVLEALERNAEAAGPTYHSLQSTAAPSTIETGATASLAVALPIEFLAVKLVQEVCDESLKALRNLGTVLLAIADGPVSGKSPALARIRAQLEGGAPGQIEKIPLPKSTATEKERNQERLAFIRDEYLHVWIQMQEEWLILLSNLIQAPLRTLGQKTGPGIGSWESSTGDSKRPTLAGPAGWLEGFADFADKALGGGSVHDEVADTAVVEVRKEPSKLTFSLESAFQGDLDGSAGQNGRGDAKERSRAKNVMSDGFKSLITKSLADHPGTSYLTPSVFLPLATFVEAASSIIDTATGGPLQQSAPLGGIGGFLWGAAAAPSDDGRRWLKQYMDDFVEEVFLPKVWVDMRARCASALEHPDAFRPVVVHLGLGGSARTTSGALKRPGAALGGLGQYGINTRGLLPVARFAERTLQDLVMWSQAMPSSKPEFMSMAESMMGKVLDAFQATASQTWGDSLAARLASRQDVSAAMAVEPDAALLGDVVAFYTPAGGEFDANRFAVSLRTQERPVLVPAMLRPNANRNSAHTQDLSGGGSTPASFLRGAVSMQRGFAGDGEPAEVEVMAFAFKEQPRQSDQLLCGPASAGGAGRLLALAALSEAADFIADIISDQLGNNAGGGPRPVHMDPGLSSNRNNQSLLRRLGPLTPGPLSRQRQAALAAVEARLPDRVALLVQRYRSLSGQCMRIARMDMLLLTSFLLRPLTVSSHLCEADDVKDVNPCIGQLIRTATRIADELTPQLRPSKLLYVAGCVSTCAARSCMWLLPEIYDINKSGAERMVHAISVLQPTLLNLMPAMASGILVDKLDLRQQRARVYDLARSYYSLLPLPPQEVIRAAADKPMQFSFPAWIAIFEVHVVGRIVSNGNVDALQSTLAKIYGVSRAEKFVGVLGNVVGVMQTPAEVITDTLTDVLKVGGGVLMAGGGLVLSGAMIPVQQLRKVVGSIADKLTEGGR